MTATPKKKSAATSITEEKVERYLREHPDFFERHLALLDILRLPHPAHGSVSLLERQVSLLRNKHRLLEQRMAELIANARDNERVSQHLHALACTLMRADSLDAVLALTQEALRDELQAEFVSIRLVNASSDPLHRLESPGTPSIESIFRQRDPLCGRLPKDLLETVFGEPAEMIGSAIVVPLVLEADPLGVLALGSRSVQRFGPDVGTYFVTHLGSLLTEALYCQAIRACPAQAS
jgi:uncharacterized protein YigA (DUF484 family)